MRYVLIALVLAGCASVDMSQSMDRTYGKTCAGLGFQKGTEGYANCLLKLHAAALAS